MVEGARLDTMLVLDGVRGAYPRSAMGDGCCKLSVYLHEGHYAQAPSYQKVKPRATFGVGGAKQWPRVMTTFALEMISM